MALLRLGTHWVPFRLGVSAPFSVYLTQKHSAPAYATTEPANTPSSGHSLCVGYVLHLPFFVLFCRHYAVPHGGLLLIFRLGHNRLVLTSQSFIRASQVTKTRDKRRENCVTHSLSLRLSLTLTLFDGTTDEDFKHLAARTPPPLGVYT